MLQWARAALDPIRRPPGRSFFMSIDLLREFASYPALLGRLIKYKPVIHPVQMSYGLHKDQYCLHFVPLEQPREKVVVYLHGGGWNSGTPALFSFIGQRFALSGYHCVMIGYRKAPAHRFPVQIEDVCTGYQKTLEYLEWRGIGARQIVVVGSSAGAHLGALLCYDRPLQQHFHIDSVRICGFAGLGGPYCFDCKPTFPLQRLTKQLFPPQYDRSQGEPYHKLTRGQHIPMLIIHGRHDGAVSCENALEFFARARRLDIPAQFYLIPTKRDNHSSYTAGIFLEDEVPTLKALLDWIEQQ